MGFSPLDFYKLLIVEDETEILKYMILCVDGGGTKTHILLMEDNGLVLSQGFGGPMLFTEISFEQAVNNLNIAISEASQKIKRQILTFTKVIIGLAGVDSKNEIEQAREKYTLALRQKVSGEIILVNDMMIALLSGTDNNNAVVLNAGTGSACFGFNQSGIKAKASGLDYLISDEGSAFYIGQEILRAAVKSYDGRGKKTILEDLVKQYYSIEDLVDIKSKIYGLNFHKAHIAKLSFLITQASQANDEVAQTILRDAMKELAIAIKAVVSKLEIGRIDFDLVLIGGLFTSNTINPKAFGNIINNMYPMAKIIIPKDPPVYGARKLALLHSKHDD